jgi:antirestriction protein ArdC
MPSQSEIRHAITSKILDSLKQGTVPWKQPWQLDKNCGRPRNASTMRPYNGINILLLMLHNLAFGLKSRHFATYSQWQALGGQVMRRPGDVEKGKWGCQIVFWKPVKRTTTDDTGEETAESFFLMKQYTVFSIDQVLGDHLDYLRVGYSDTTHDPEVSIRQADELIRNSRARIEHGGNRAFYDPTIDLITMPHKHQFEGAAYYESLFHELCHFAEHPNRLNWDRSKEENSYSMGELVAEMGACFVCTELGIELSEGIDNHAAYVCHWEKKLKAALENDHSFIFKASSQASKVCDYLLSFLPMPVEEPALVS